MGRRFSGRLCLLALVGALAAGAASAAADAPAPPPLPLGTDGHGVHLTVRRDGSPYRRGPVLVLTFDDSAVALWQRIAGRMLSVECVRFSRHGDRTDVVGGGGSEQPAPRRRRPIVVALRPRFDYCSIGVYHRRGPTILTRIALTPLGAIRLDRLTTAQHVLVAVRLLDRPERPGPASVAARLHGVVLDSPAQAPPPGVLGVYGDGAAHMYAAQTDRAGELLFLEQQGDVTRSNVTEYLTNSDGFDS